MRYRVDYIRHAAREIRKLEGRMRLGEEGPNANELLELLKTLGKALDEMAEAIEGLQRAGD